MPRILARPPPPVFTSALLLAASSCRADDTAVVTPPPVAQAVAAGHKLDAQANDAARHNRAGVPEGLEVAVLGGGCFWGMQALLRQIEGVVSTQVGYAGGAAQSASYASVSSGHTGHAESVKVVFDPTRLSYEQLLLWFFRIHDPTALNRQGNDVGTQYRSVIFYQTSGQAKTAHAARERAQASGRFDAPLTTQIVAAKQFYAAEAYHQDYLQQHPGGYTCHFVRPFDL